MRAIGFLAVAVCAAGAWAQAPAYTTAGIVNASDYSAGPFAPGSVISIFGTNLSRSAYAMTAADISFPYLPTQLNYTEVIVNNSPAALFYVSPGQVNFMVPPTAAVGQMTVQVVREGLAGPLVTLPLVAAAPALFVGANNFVLATHGDYSLVTDAAPARSGEIIVLFATGMGKSSVSIGPAEIPQTAAQIANLGTLGVSLAGTAVDPMLIKYAGVTPGSAGLYQINLQIPGGPPADPAIQVTVAGKASAAGLKLAVK